jgi:hypothetical protein
MPQTKTTRKRKRSQEFFFSGNITIARGRFRRISELALKKFQAPELNGLAFMIARFLDVNESNHGRYTREHTIEQKKSRARERRNAQGRVLTATP